MSRCAGLISGFARSARTECSRGRRDRRIFEIGRTFIPSSGKEERTRDFALGKYCAQAELAICKRAAASICRSQGVLEGLFQICRFEAARYLISRSRRRLGRRLG